MPTRHTIVHVRALVWIGARWFAVGLIAGAIAALLAVYYAHAQRTEPVRIGEIELERSAADYSVLRIPFVLTDVERAWCHLVLHHETRGWALRC